MVNSGNGGAGPTFDASGEFVPGEYVVGLFVSIFLDKEPDAKIVDDPRVVWNMEDIVSEKSGAAVQSKTGHAFIKQTMRIHELVILGLKLQTNMI